MNTEIGENMSTEEIRIVFMGTPQFAVPALESLIKNYQVVLVVCQPDKEQGRKKKIIPSPVKELALKNDIEVFQPTKIKEDYQKILDDKPDIIITCAYGQIIPKILLDTPEYGCINIHGSLLPKLRGGAPIHWALINGETETGITIMHMSEKMDAGDIISQAKVKITEDTILDTLYEEMSYLGARLLSETLPSIIEGTAQRKKQDESKVTFGYNITKEDEKIDFSKTGKEIFNQVRGLNSTPGAYANLNGKRMKIFEVKPIKKELTSKNYGTIEEVSKNSFKVTCKDGYIEVLDIAVEGKKRCKVKDYLNGIDKSKLVGSVFNNE